MGIECAYSFKDLYKAAKGRYPSSNWEHNFMSVTQEERNKIVKKLAKLASWYTDDRQGNDSEIYTAFAPQPLKY